MEWFVLALFAIAFVLLCIASAQGAEKKVDELGLDLITRVQIIWKDTRCEEWPEKNGDYKCKGTFYVHPNGIKAKKSEN